MTVLSKLFSTRYRIVEILEPEGILYFIVESWQWPHLKWCRVTIPKDVRVPGYQYVTMKKMVPCKFENREQAERFVFSLAPPQRRVLAVYRFE